MQPLPGILKEQVGPDDPTVVNPPGRSITSSVTLGLGRDTTDDTMFPDQGNKNKYICPAGRRLFGRG